MAVAMVRGEKIHRIRIADWEIKVISKMAIYYVRVLNHGPQPIPDHLKLSEEEARRIADRFSDWGRGESPYLMHPDWRKAPYYPRPRRRK